MTGHPSQPQGDGDRLPHLLEQPSTLPTPPWSVAFEHQVPASPDVLFAEIVEIRHHLAEIAVAMRALHGRTADVASVHALWGRRKAANRALAHRVQDLRRIFEP